MRTKEIPENKIVFITGSTRFKTFYQTHALNFTLKGWIVLIPSVYQHAEGLVFDKDTKKRLKDMDKPKILLADEVFVINPDGYIGHSTSEDIQFAQSQGKTITYMEPASVSASDQR
ncbi:MAG: hypothetical protein AB1805_02235 [Nitrospirota bacterium]